MTDPRKIIKKIRHIPIKIKKRDTSKDWLVEIKAERERQETWQDSLKIKREHNFALALAGLEEYRQERQAEKDRQKEIEEERLKNLKKARKVLAKQRSEENE